MASAGAEALVDLMREAGIPITLENYISCNWGDDIPDDADVMEDLPDELQAQLADSDLDDPDFDDPDEDEESDRFPGVYDGDVIIREGELFRDGVSLGKVRDVRIQKVHELPNPLTVRTGYIHIAHDPTLTIHNTDYDPNEPRDPKGSPTGGQWTKGGAESTPLHKYSHPPGTPAVQKGGPTGDRGGGFTDEEIDRMPPEEIARRMKNAETVIHSIPPTDQIHTPEREALRKSIEDQIYSYRLKDRVQGHEATIVLGLPGSGKTTLVKPMLDSGASLEIEGDNAKALLPEFGDGSGAWAVHEEASQIMRHVLARAVQNGDNIFWPRIDSKEKIVNDIAMLKKAGYTVHVKLVATQAEDAAKSAVRRFLKTGRYVSPKMILEYGTLSRDTFDEARKSGLANSTEIYRRGSAGGFEKVG